MEKQDDNWFLIGDIHGNEEPIRYFYEENKGRLELDKGVNHIILLGDVGANFALRGQRDNRFKQAMSEMPFTYICLRGNHEARVTTAMARNPEGWK